MLSNPPRRLGAILSGGRSSRFGSDKAEARWGERRLIDHAAAALAPWVETVVICGPHGGDWPNVPDRPQTGLGPLGGLCGALHHATVIGVDQVVLIACDMPQVPEAVLAQLVRGGSRYCRDAPVLGCWDVRLASTLETFLEREGSRSMRAWGDLAGAEPIDCGVLANVNTPADLAAL
jgi:molybdenum cofactor guanylyltransferase